MAPWRWCLPLNVARKDDTCAREPGDLYSGRAWDHHAEQRVAPTQTCDIESFWKTTYVAVLAKEHWIITQYFKESLSMILTLHGLAHTLAFCFCFSLVTSPLGSFMYEPHGMIFVWKWQHTGIQHVLIKGVPFESILLQYSSSSDMICPIIWDG